MPFVNVEIKAKTTKSTQIRSYLLNHGAEFKGLDLQTDTYFKVPTGRLKLREGKIENNLIYYERPNQEGPKQSNFQLVQSPDPVGLKTILSNALGIIAIVEKRREIFYIENVKFHLDELEGLGNFVEIEASNLLHNLDISKLHEQCNFYMSEFGIEEQDLLKMSYSDMLDVQNG